MTEWLRENWRWAALNLAAMAALATVLREASQVRDFSNDFTPMIESAKWAIRFLLFSLAMTPLNTLLGWRSGIKLRKPAGLWAFGFGALHFGFYLLDMQAEFLRYPVPSYYAGLGLVGLLILTAMAVTSTRWAMKRMGKSWKRLHKLVYPASVAVLVHGLLESISSKRVLAFDEYARDELILYLAILILLLAARIPFVRAGLVTLRGVRRRVARS
jgi:sulfoxide reductase heme-binding subunit YedZ